MKILNRNLKKGEVRVKAENPEDLWYLSNIIDPGDLIKGHTLRKIKIGREGQRKIKSQKRRVFITIKTERVEFHPYSNVLRVLGVIVEAPDDVQKGSHHTFNLEENSSVTIIKEKWLSYQIERLNEAATLKLPKVLICVVDREKAYFAKLKRNNYEVLSKFEGAVEKKAEQIQAKGNFYADVIKQIHEYDKRYKLDSVVVASPAFFKEDLMENLKDEELREKIALATCSSVTENAFKEVLKRDEVRAVLRKDRISKEISLIDSLLQEIAKNNLAVYGLKHTKTAAEAGAVKILLVSDAFIQSMKEKQKYAIIDSLMKLVEQTKGSINIISSANDGGKRLDGLGGIAAILRYKLSF